MEWLKQQPDLGTGSEMGDTSALALLETIKVYVQLNETYGAYYTTFSVSDLTGSVAIVSPKDKPTLSVIYRDNPPLTLSRDAQYTSALFLTLSDQEYLVTASRYGICQWNLTKNTTSVVYKFKEQDDWCLCLIDERTVACANKHASSGGFIQIYIFKIDTEMWALSSSHWAKASRPASDICFVKTRDGSPCLLLSFPHNNLIQCLEMVGGKVKWQVNEQQMGHSFRPLNICTDGSTVFVANAVPAVLHLLSGEDGSVLTSISLRSFGICLPGCVLSQGGHLYIGHLNYQLDTYCISKFIKPTEV